MRDYVVRIKVINNDKEYYKTIGSLMFRDDGIFLEIFTFQAIYKVVRREDKEPPASGYVQHRVLSKSALLDKDMIVGNIFYHQEKDNIILNLDMFNKKIYVFKSKPKENVEEVPF